MIAARFGRYSAALVLLLPAAHAGCREAPASRGATAEIVTPLASVSPATIADAIEAVRRSLAAHPASRHVIQLPAGTFDMTLTGTQAAAIDVSRLDACPGGLVVRGRGMDRTVLVKDNDGVGVLGRASSCITIEGLTLRQARLEVSQGTVVSVSPGELVVELPRGFPSFRDLAGVDPTRDRNGRAIRWLKHFVMAGGTPRIVEGEKPVRWTGAEPIGTDGRRWRVRIDDGRPGGTAWKPGDLLSVTAKSGGQAYRFTTGHDIGFVGVRWLGDARGKFRFVDRVTIRDSVIEPPAPIGGVPFLLAGSGGGPQIGHPGDPLVTGNVVENNRFVRSGDDAVAMMDASGVVRNNRISDATRGILIVGKGQVTLEGNVLERAPVLRKASGGRSRPLNPCRADEDCRPRTRAQ